MTPWPRTTAAVGMARLSPEQVAERGAHARVVRSGPVDAAAAGAAAELLLSRADLLRDDRRHRRLVDRLQGEVATQAQREGTGAGGEVVALRHFAQLRFGLERMHVAAVRDLAALEQLAVAAQHDAALGLGEAPDPRVAAV